MSEPAEAAARLWSYVEAWRSSCADFVALARSLGSDDVERDTDLAGWNVHDVVAHTAHLEAVLAGAPEETVPVPDGLPHVKGLMGFYTEQGVIARRDRSVAELADEIEQSVATRYGALQADPPTDPDAMPPKVFGDLPWPNKVLLSNRVLDVWMHEQDIRRAVDRPGGYDTPGAAHAIRVLGRALPMVLGKRVAASPGTSVVVAVPTAGRTFSALVGDDGRATPTEVSTPSARITLSAEDFVVLAGGRRTPEQTSPAVVGDTALADAVLANLAVTP